MALRVPRRLLARHAPAALIALLHVLTASAASENGEVHGDTVAFSVRTEASVRSDALVREALNNQGIDASGIDVEHGLDHLLGTAEVGLFGLEAPTACTGSPLTEEAFEQALVEADEHVSFAEFPAAVEDLTTLRQRLACLVEHVDSDRLHRLHLLEGVASWFMGERNVAYQAFERAVVIDEGYRWGGEFGPRPQEAHVQAMRGVLARPSATLSVAWSGEGTLAVLDGRPIDISDGWGQVEVRSGEHLLQVFTTQGEPWRAVLQLEGEAVVVQRQAFLDGMVALEAWDAAEYDGPGRPVLASLTTWMHRNGYDDGYLVVIPPPLTQRSDEALPPPSGRTILRIDPVAQTVRPPDVIAERLRSLPWRGRFGMDGGLLAYRRGDAAYAYGKVEVSIYVHALPRLAVGWTVGFASFWDNDLAANILMVPIRTRLRISPDYGTIRPYVDMAMVIHWLGTHETAFYAFGGEGTVGLDVRPLTSKLFGCGAGVGLGHVGGLTFNVQGGCSVQW